MTVAYHTNDAIYNAAIDRLRRSLDALDLPYVFETINSRGRWVANCAYKPAFILSMMNQYPDVDLLYVDADAVVRQRPALFDAFPGDFGVHYKDGRELLSGTLFFRANHRCVKLVTDWVMEQVRRQNDWDQKTLQAILPAHQKAGLQVVNLPATYTQIFDTMRRVGKPVIEHFQASRKVRAQERGHGRIRTRGTPRQAPWSQGVSVHRQIPPAR